MSGQMLTVIIGALLSGGLITAVVAWRRETRQAPIERRTAEFAIAQVHSEIRTADIDGLRNIIEALREEVGALRGRVETAEGRATAAEERATAAEQRASADAAYIDVLLEHWPTPPPPARPT